MTSSTFLCIIALLACAAMWIGQNGGPSSDGSASTPAQESATSPSLHLPLRQESPPSSQLTLPSRSDIISILLDHYHDGNSDDERRNLQAKFASLNKIFSRISLKLPNAEVSRSGLKIKITQLVCRNLNVRDIQVSHSAQSATSQKVNVNVSGLKVNCSFRWEYKWTIFNGSGSGSAKLNPSSSASVALQFISENYAIHSPHDVGIPNCNTNIQIEDMGFDGDGLGIIGGIMDLFEGMFRDTVEGELSSTVCSELRGLGDDALDDLLLTLSDKIDTYLEPLDASLEDPLHVENTIQVPAIESGEDIGEPLYMNFQELEEYAGEWINSALEQVNSFLG
eukprot:CAMPEP_0183722274 /NCGR_PEP_ID=MMETSP0737-20130205/14280_1 /TAXON_ID=385413 /ORGANISM="Thalassiosira miniscula, Strain CCMP1093" /LENGTH=336 /DNA_ID=CAMNT_0025952407 /DNA_START=172 /DNA_END=1178 /DNA_ORIENTATION=+